MKAFARGASFAFVAFSAVPCFAAGDASDAAGTGTAAPRIPFVAPVVHLGLLPYGRGQDENGCSGACAGFAANDASYQHGVAFGFGAEALFTVLDVLRFGPSLFYVLPNHVDLDGAKDHFGVGSDLGIDLVVEAAPAVTRTLRLVPRLQGGITVLFPGGQLAQDLDAVRAVCPDGASGCDGVTGAHVGFNIGVGVGALYTFSEHLRFRADLLVQYYTVNLYSVGARLLGNGIDVSERLSGGRSFILLGAEY